MIGEYTWADSGGRPGDTYRGARRNAARGARMSQRLKAERVERGETRPQADRRRWLAKYGKGAS